MGKYKQSFPLCNLQASRNPTVTDDDSCGFSIGSLWGRENRIYKCSDATNGAAVWDLQGGSGGGSEITNGTKQTALQLNSNWGVTEDYTPVMQTNTSTVLTGQSEHDYFYGTDSVTASIYKYEIIKIATVLSVIRIPLKY